MREAPLQTLTSYDTHTKHSDPNCLGSCFKEKILLKLQANPLETSLGDTLSSSISFLPVNLTGPIPVPLRGDPGWQRESAESREAQRWSKRWSRWEGWQGAEEAWEPGWSWNSSLRSYHRLFGGHFWEDWWGRTWRGRDPWHRKWRRWRGRRHGPGGRSWRSVVGRRKPTRSPWRVPEDRRRPSDGGVSKDGRRRSSHRGVSGERPSRGVPEDEWRRQSRGVPADADEWRRPTPKVWCWSQRVW